MRARAGRKIEREALIDVEHLKALLGGLSSVQKLWSLFAFALNRLLLFILVTLSKIKGEIHPEEHKNHLQAGQFIK